MTRRNCRKCWRCWKRGEADLVVGSRYVEGGSADSFNRQRAGASALATEVAKRVLRVKIADPMSGFFMIRRDRFEQLAPQLSTQGFKILLDIVATARGDLRIVEIPYTFGSRLHGESKLDSMVALDFLGLVLAKLTDDIVSLRFLLFAMVGSIGLFVHLARLFVALEVFESAVSGSAGLRRAVGHDQQFHPEQFSHLSRPAAEGVCDPARPAAVLSGLQRRSVRQCRRGVLGLRSGTDLVAGGGGGRADGRGLELRDVRTVRLAQAMKRAMNPNEVRLVRDTVFTILALVALRLVAAAWTPLTFDEAYYWMWSKHLAVGYYDHPPGVARVIRLGTMIAGDTELGVRLVSILLALPMSWAVYRAAAILFGGRRVAATATILLNVTLMAAVGTLIVTPDAPLLVASSFILFYLAKVLETGRGAWWLAVGAAVGAALLSKYTALFFGPAILIWLASVPKLRRWLISPWPYLGGLVSLRYFAGHSLECRSPLGLLHQADSGGPGSRISSRPSSAN